MAGMSLHTELTASFVCVAGRGTYEVMYVCVCAHVSMCACECVPADGEGRSQAWMSSVIPHLIFWDGHSY